MSAPVLNDVHSGLNPTQVRDVEAPSSAEELQGILKRVRNSGQVISIAGGRHAMGGQQFAEDSLHIDTRKLDKVLAWDPENGIIDVEAGIQWPALFNQLALLQRDHFPQGELQPWGVIQKPTGADTISLGGAVSANIHGRGLKFKPLIDNIESITLLDAHGDWHTLSREQESALFNLVIGGYGLFGMVYSVRLKLARRQRLLRQVSLITVDELLPAFDDVIARGGLYGDFQFPIDPQHADFIHRGIFSVYLPLERNSDSSLLENKHPLSLKQWRELVLLAHTDKTRAFDSYAKYYLGTTGTAHWSDSHQQWSPYREGYHAVLDRVLKSTCRGSEMITEINVPRAKLTAFLADVRKDFRANNVNLIYGTIRLIQRDQESFLAWAKEDFACTIFNLHVDHTSKGIQQATEAFRRLIDLAIHYGGTYYLTYHHYATPAQLVACYPEFPEFLRQKSIYDPDERFQSEWYRHYKPMFS